MAKILDRTVSSSVVDHHADMGFPVPGRHGRLELYGARSLVELAPEQSAPARERHAIANDQLEQPILRSPSFRPTWLVHARACLACLPSAPPIRPSSTSC